MALASEQDTARGSATSQVSSLECSGGRLAQRHSPAVPAAHQGLCGTTLEHFTECSSYLCLRLFALLCCTGCLPTCLSIHPSNQSFILQFLLISLGSIWENSSDQEVLFALFCFLFSDLMTKYILSITQPLLAWTQDRPHEKGDGGKRKKLTQSATLFSLGKVLEAIGCPPLCLLMLLHVPG